MEERQHHSSFHFHHSVSYAILATINSAAFVTARSFMMEFFSSSPIISLILSASILYASAILSISAAKSSSEAIIFSAAATASSTSLLWMVFNAVIQSHNPVMLHFSSVSLTAATAVWNMPAQYLFPLRLPDTHPSPHLNI